MAAGVVAKPRVVDVATPAAPRDVRAVGRCGDGVARGEDGRCRCGGLRDRRWSSRGGRVLVPERHRAARPLRGLADASGAPTTTAAHAAGAAGQGVVPIVVSLRRLLAGESTDAASLI
ncbi:hypothetical protein HPB50_003484 [Hyalomma asiaticum]|uniref:Uncharacterized protein n=1 Tax=Hyalomma asiaticum TaxID=266040 RepID=A0ACB7SBD9_HYAAI|nr:hypothetical protein HPB50_003484 [Hyalomma asiaticum]